MLTSAIVIGLIIFIYVIAPSITAYIVTFIIIMSYYGLKYLFSKEERQKREEEQKKKEERKEISQNTKMFLDEIKKEEKKEKKHNLI